MTEQDRRALPYFAASQFLLIAGLASGRLLYLAIGWLLGIPLAFKANSISQTWHWRTLAIALRAVELMAAVVGAGFLVWAFGIVHLLAPQAPMITPGQRFAYVGLGLLALGAAALTLRRPAWRPDRPQGADADREMGGRTWWTGESKATAPQDAA